MSKTKQSKILSSSSLLFATIIIVNFGNYLINLFLGRVLGPEEFAEAGVLATGVLILSFIALGFQMTAAKYSATYSLGKSTKKLAFFQQWFSRKSSYVGLVLAILLVSGAPALRNFLHFRSTVPLLLIAAGIPLYLNLSAGRGFLQGQMKFKKLAGTYLLEMIGRLLVTAFIIGALIYWGGAWITEGIAIGFLASFAAAYWISKSKVKNTQSAFPAVERKKIFSFMLIVSAYELSQIMISHSDVILVKHYFSNEEAGLYNALALIGRIVFFATWSVVTLLFPKVVQREQQGLPHQHLFYRSLLIVVVLGLGITLGCYLFADIIVFFLFGPAFASVSELLWLYASATTLFACSNVFTYYYLSLKKYLPVILSGIAGILQIAMITLFHESVNMVIHVQILLMGSLFITMLTFHTIKTFNYEKTKNRVSFSVSPQ